MRAARHLVALCAVAVLPGQGLGAEALPCPDDEQVIVEAQAPADVARVCEVVARARPDLAACHLHQSDPLVIRVVARITHPVDSCMAQYDCRARTIAVTSPATLPEVLTADSIWARIAPDALFDSLIVHELAHAFIDQAECRGIACLAEDEYIAYALQIDSLAPADRAAVMAGHRITDAADTGRLNDFIVLAGPNHFAQAAWLHFSLPGNGCAFVQKLIDGEATLQAHPE
jgi:hypothetical protein